MLQLAIVLGLALMIQAGLARIWPGAPRYFDLLMVPVVWYGSVRGQRSAMLVGCAAGLLEDAWFDLETFGLDGFKKTAIGWMIGGSAARVDLGHSLGRFSAGALAVIADSLLDAGLRGLLDQQSGSATPLEWAVRVLSTGMLAAFAGGTLDRFLEGEGSKRR